MKEPDALTIDQAAKLLGTSYCKLIWLNRDGDLQMVIVRGKKYFFKENIIEYLIRPEVTFRPKIGNYKEVISEFKKKQCRVRENEIRRQKRAAKRAKGTKNKWNTGVWHTFRPHVILIKSSKILI